MEDDIELPSPRLQPAMRLLLLGGVAGVLVFAVVLYGAWSLLGPSPEVASDAPAPVLLPAPTEAPPAPAAAAPPLRPDPAEATAAASPAPSGEPGAARPAPQTSSSRRPSTGAASPLPYAVVPTDAVADLETPETPNSLALLDRYAASASAGRLTPSDLMVMEMIEDDDLGYDRSRMLLIMNAKSKGDSPAVKRYLDDLSRRPENAYNPVILVEYARYLVNTGDYRQALDKAALAERHWARLPSELVLAKKTEIYEIQAAASQGLFYRSEDDFHLLDTAVRGWQKYREHVDSLARSDLVARADREIAKLETTRKRLK